MPTTPEPDASSLEGSWGPVVERVAREAGYHKVLTNDDVEFALWERTAYPMGSLVEIVNQLHRLFSSLAAGHAGEFCERCGVDLHDVEGSNGACAACLAALAKELEGS